MPKTINAVRVAIHKVARGDDAIVARATIGEGQEGAWSMHVDNKFITGGTKPEDVKLGVARKLRGSLLEISAVIKDVRKETDRLTLTARVTPGETRPKLKISEKGAPGDNAAYSIVIHFL
jgi:hypothetical protein